MKKLFTFLLIMLTIGGVSAQTGRFVTSTSLSAPVVYYKPGTDTLVANSIARAIKPIAATLAAYPSADTSGASLIKIISGKVTILQDPAIPILKTQVGNIQTQDKVTASAISTLQAQSTSYQQQITAQQILIDKLTMQLAALLDWQAKVKAANQ